MDIAYSAYDGLRIQIKPSNKDRSIISFLYPDKKTDLGEVAIDPVTNKVIVLDDNGNIRFYINTTRFSGGYGLLLAPQFYDSLKYITITEIVRREW